MGLIWFVCKQKFIIFVKLNNNHNMEDKELKITLIAKRMEAKATIEKLRYLTENTDINFNKEIDKLLDRILIIDKLLDKLK